MRGAGSLAAPAAPVDAQFNYVTMLLHGDGTNGAQNNTFLDSSTNNFTITRNGNTTQGSFSPYGPNWSNYFNGSSSYLTVPYSANLSFGTGNFCVEFWLYWTGGANENNPIMNNAGGGFNIKLSATNSANWALENSYVGEVADFGTAPTKNTWHHIAVTRSSGTLYAFIDGTQVFSGSNSTNFTNPSTWYIGANGYSVSTYYIIGNLSNLRIVVGSAVYTSNFTPSTTPLIAITNTQLLTCQSNRFIDNSTNNFAITATSTSVQRFNPFGASSPYSTSVIGGSGYFDDDGDFLTSTGVSLSTGNLTIEFWIYPVDGSVVYNCVIDTRISGGDITSGFGVFQYGKVIEVYQASMVVSSAANSIAINAWNHVALVRNSGTCQLYINGVASGASGSNTTNLNSTQRRIGSATTSPFYYFGYISDLRENSTALYTSTFTPPTAPLTAVTNTTLLLNYTNGAIFDNAMMIDLETVGDTQISTSVKKYGTGSMAFDGTGDWIRSFDNLPIAFGSGDFTVEGWIYLNNVSSTKGIMYGLGNNSFGLRVGQSYLGNVNGLNISRSGIADLEYCAFTFSTNTWYHIAVVRSGTTIYFFVNGTQQTTLGSGGGSYNFAIPSTGFIVGANNDTNERFNGYIDDFRITKGYARYTANFTPPIAALLDIGRI